MVLSACAARGEADMTRLYGLGGIIRYDGCGMVRKKDIEEERWKGLIEARKGRVSGSVRARLQS